MKRYEELVCTSRAPCGYAGCVPCRREASLVLTTALGIPLAKCMNVIKDGRVQEAALICSCLSSRAGAEESQKCRAAPA